MAELTLRIRRLIRWNRLRMRVLYRMVWYRCRLRMRRRMLMLRRRGCRLIFSMRLVSVVGCLMRLEWDRYFRWVLPLRLGCMLSGRLIIGRRVNLLTLTMFGFLLIWRLLGRCGLLVSFRALRVKLLVGIFTLRRSMGELLGRWFWVLRLL